MCQSVDVCQKLATPPHWIYAGQGWNCTSVTPAALEAPPTLALTACLLPVSRVVPDRLPPDVR